MSLSYLDWLIILVYLTLIIYTGYLAKKYIAKISDFLVADRSMDFHLGFIL